VTPERRWDEQTNAAPPAGQFVRYYRMTATAYAPLPSRMEGGRFTRTMRDGRGAHGVAVDPGIIPLGSHLWIPGYGHAIADDIGSAIRGHHVDLRMQVYDHVTAWGRRPVRVYVLQEPPQ
jgi:3D (Asp-Asp-Asp) domain-containing protein